MDDEESFSIALIALKSRDAKIRNQAAIDLMDSCSPMAVAPLVAAIEEVENRGARGTLIYALSGFDCSSRFAQIFRWATEGGFEASCGAISILREQNLKPSKEERAECLVLLSQLRSQTECDDDLIDELSSFIE
ncbi:hypothetical protein GTP81_13650 [Rugamonas sp. FT107W]|uniref:HEAT repeat domain-containing protein n=1 Tax=Duganella vulcania TaxID=2692166 RepID=A0A845HEV1_9BURK|nr:hypothetical protein [Duganella vulcania]MYN17802.1 hypothetical protein [Duganella vulcania]